MRRPKSVSVCVEREFEITPDSPGGLKELSQFSDNNLVTLSFEVDVQPSISPSVGGLPDSWDPGEPSEALSVVLLGVQHGKKLLPVPPFIAKDLVSRYEDSVCEEAMDEVDSNPDRYGDDYPDDEE